MWMLSEQERLHFLDIDRQRDHCTEYLEQLYVTGPLSGQLTTIELQIVV